MAMRDLKNILSVNSELWLNYLGGQKSELLQEIPPVKRSMFIHFLRFFRFLIMNIGKRKESTASASSEILFYVGTLNQDAALQTTIAALEKRGERVCVLANPRVFGRRANHRYLSCYTGAGEAFLAVYLLGMRVGPLLNEVKRKRSREIWAHLSTFMYSYIYLATFYSVLSSGRPRFVVTANDHSVANRSLIAVAHYLGIKTIYIQHASVNPAFPALRFNYAFLDGVSALEVYRRCERNAPANNDLGPRPYIFLSGQKKQISTSLIQGGEDVGLAFNKLDSIDKILETVGGLTRSGRRVHIRWHPATPRSALGKMARILSENKQVVFSDPVQQSVSEFFGSISSLVAGNSSIHLEAAIAGLRCVYYQMGDYANVDYYGYVRSGLAQMAETEHELITGLGDASDAECRRTSAIQVFSHTFGTSWQGREGELLAESLLQLKDGVSEREIFGFVDRFGPS